MILTINKGIFECILGEGGYVEAFVSPKKPLPRALGPLAEVCGASHQIMQAIKSPVFLG
jgi:hypothetical protein